MLDRSVTPGLRVSSSAYLRVVHASVVWFLANISLIVCERVDNDLRIRQIRDGKDGIVG